MVGPSRVGSGRLSSKINVRDKFKTLIINIFFLKLMFKKLVGFFQTTIFEEAFLATSLCEYVKLMTEKVMVFTPN